MGFLQRLRGIWHAWTAERPEDSPTPRLRRSLDNPEVPRAEDVTFGLMTVLAHERVAARGVLDARTQVTILGEGGHLTYDLARVFSTSRGHHTVAVARLEAMGNRGPVFLAHRMKRDFPNLKSVIMCGIGGAVPNPEKADHHVRLGDVVISDRVFAYDFGRDTAKGFEMTPLFLPASPRLIEAANRLVERALEGDRPWEASISAYVKRNGTDWERPPPHKDVLYDSEVPSRILDHPPESVRSTPHIFVGTIASADRLQKNPKKRDELRTEHRAKAIDMEAAGIAEAARHLDLNFIVVRGTCDYCDSHKGDDWQNYAALAAAACCKALLEELAADISGMEIGSVPIAVTSEPLSATATDMIGAVSQELAADFATALPEPSTKQIDVNELLGDRAEVFKRELESHLSVLEFEAAREMSTDVEAFLTRHETEIPAEIAAELYKLLARASLGGSTPRPDREAVLRARRLIDKARVIRRERNG